MDINEQLRIINRRAGDNLRVNVAKAILNVGAFIDCVAYVRVICRSAARAPAIDSSPCPAANRTWMTDAGRAIGGNSQTTQWRLRGQKSLKLVDAEFRFSFLNKNKDHQPTNAPQGPQQAQGPQ